LAARRLLDASQLAAQDFAGAVGVVDHMPGCGLSGVLALHAASAVDGQDRGGCDGSPPGGSRRRLLGSRRGGGRGVVRVIVQQSGGKRRGRFDIGFGFCVRRNRNGFIGNLFGKGRIGQSVVQFHRDTSIVLWFEENGIFVDGDNAIGGRFGGGSFD